jgi:hypothetical protein
MTTGARRSLDRPEAVIAIAEKREEVVQHLGDTASVIQRDLAHDYARTHVIIETVFANIEQSGVFAPKGKTRAAVTLLMSLLDRRMRLAQAIGLERRTKPVHPLDAVRAAVIEANKHQPPQEPNDGHD